jgi:hypothetical protein
MDRSALSQALAKVIAYKNVGNDAKANYWAGVLMLRLEWAGVIPEKVEGDDECWLR